MARKQNDESAISLFSFQDIITSLTGIMFLVVLLLVLVMLTNKKPTAEEVVVDPQSQQLQQQIQQLKAELAALQQDRSTLDEELEKLRQLSPEVLEARKNELYEQLQQTRQAITQEKETLTRNQQQLQAWQQLLADTQQELQKQLQKKDEQLKKQKKVQKQIQKQKEKNQQQSKVMAYTIERDSFKSPLLMEVSAAGIQLLIVDSQAYHDFRKPDNFEKSLSDAYAFLSTLSSSSYYLTVVVKPEAFEYSSKIRYELKQKGFSRGMEIMPDNVTSIFEEQKP